MFVLLLVSEKQVIVLTLQTAESRYPYLCEPALTNNYFPSFFLPTRDLRNS